LNGCLIDKILDVASAKGTGKWAIQQAAERNIAMPIISVALDTRNISSCKEEREAISLLIKGPYSIPMVEPKQIVEDLRHALYIAILCTYAQGLHTISAASATYKWSLNLSEILRIWKGGCIIRGHVLKSLHEVYLHSPDLNCLLTHEYISGEINTKLGSLRRISTLAIASGISSPAFLSCISYIDAFRCNHLPTNLIQAQRDFFGAHTYHRTDVPGIFHSNWTDTEG
jgi:6-phosphogluconate dehydrogenase